MEPQLSKASECSLLQTSLSYSLVVLVLYMNGKYCYVLTYIQKLRA